MNFQLQGTKQIRVRMNTKNLNFDMRKLTMLLYLILL